MEEGTDNGEMPTQIIRSDKHTAPSVSVTYFTPDALKDGGEYRTVAGAVVKIDLYQRTLTLDDGKIVSIDDVVKLEGEIFKDYGPV